MALHINRQWCKGCGICMAFCPKQALTLDAEDKAVHDPERCVLCGMCELYCPDLAIAMDEEAQKAPDMGHQARPLVSYGAEQGGRA